MQDHLPMHHLRPLPYFNLTELERRKLLNNWQIDGAELGNTERTETSSFEFTKTNLEKISQTTSFTCILSRKHFKNEITASFEGLPQLKHIFPPSKNSEQLANRRRRTRRQKEVKLLTLTLQEQTWKNISNYFLHLYPVKKTFQKGDHCLT